MVQHYSTNSHVKISVAQLLFHSMRQKPGLGIGNRDQGPILVSVFEPKLFCRNRNFYFQKISNFLMFFLPLIVGYRFLKA